MDVRAWLQNTADKEPPDEEDRAGFPDYLQVERYTAAEDTRVNQSKRKRASSETHSVQRPLPRGRRGGHGRAAERASSSDHVQGAHTGTASSRTSSSNERRESSHDRRFNRTFERRARHKTKEDRYEPKAKKPRKAHEARKDRKGKEKSKSKRRKSHRSGDGARTAGLVTSFQLKDRPKHNRLTLRPADVSAGIFKHGRAGAPITGRGSGLPDLVFNEMRFLRRPREHQDEITPNEPDKDRHRADIPQEGNISTYFAKPLPEPPRTHEQHRADPKLDHGPGQRQQESQEAAHEFTCRRNGGAEAVGDRAPNSFLGFGSRGLHQEANASNWKSNSCYTWSESVPAPKSPAGGESAPTITLRAYGTTHPDTGTEPRPRSKRRPAERSEDFVARSAYAGSAGRWVPSNRGNGSASVMAYQPAALGQPSRRRNGLLTRQQSSISLPRSVLDLPVPSGHAVLPGHAPGSCPTSEILRIGDHGRRDEEQPISCHRDVLSNDHEDQENKAPSTSTPTSKLLRRAFHTIAGPQTKQPRNAHEPLLDGFKRHKRSPYLEQASDDTAYREHVMAESKQEHYQPSPEQPTFSMPERGFSRSTEASRAKQQRPTARPGTRALGFMATASVMPRSHHRPYKNNGPGADDGMIDDLATYPPVPLGYQCTYTHNRQAEDLLRRLTSHQETHEAGADYLPTPSDGQVDFGAHMEEDGGGSYLRTNSEIAETLTGRRYEQMWSNNDAAHAAPVSGEDRMQRGSLPGFWKPNKLY